MPSINDNYFGFANSKNHGGNSGATIRVGRWGLVFFLLYPILLILIWLVYPSSLACLPLLLLLVSIADLIITLALLASWSLFIHIYCIKSGLEIGEELGKFELSVPDGWNYQKYITSSKKSLDLKESSPHILIVGGSQTGKSVTIKTILLKLLEKDAGQVVLDYHGEYGFLAERGFALINAQDYNPLASNFEGEDFENIVNDFVEAFLVAFENTGDLQLAILKKKIEDKHNLAAALNSIGNEAKASKSFTEKDRLAGLHLRLEKIVRCAPWGYGTLKSLIKENRKIVFDFSGIRERDAADFYAENILRRYLSILLAEKKPTNIIIDEAHRLNTKFLAERGIETTTLRIARESGKFGGRLIVASQNLTDFPPGFSANFGNIISFRMPSGADLQALEQLSGINAGKLQAVMNGFHKGEALLIGPQNHYSVIKVKMAQIQKSENKPSSERLSDKTAQTMTLRLKRRAKRIRRMTAGDSPSSDQSAREILQITEPEEAKNQSVQKTDQK